MSWIMYALAILFLGTVSASAQSTSQSNRASERMIQFSGVVTSVSAGAVDGHYIYGTFSGSEPGVVLSGGGVGPSGFGFQAELALASRVPGVQDWAVGGGKAHFVGGYRPALVSGVFKFPSKGAGRVRIEPGAGLSVLFGAIGGSATLFVTGGQQTPYSADVPRRQDLALTGAADVVVGMSRRVDLVPIARVHLRLTSRPPNDAPEPQDGVGRWTTSFGGGVRVRF